MLDYSFSKQDYDKIFVPGGRFIIENMIMFNCTDDIYNIFNMAHSTSSEPTCVVTIDKKIEDSFVNACQRLGTDDLTTLYLSSVLVCGLITQDILMKTPSDNEFFYNIAQPILDVDIFDLLNHGCIEDIIDFYNKLPLGMKISDLFRKNKIEDLSFLCPDGITNAELQMTINEYFTQRNSFNVKLFTKDNRLASMFSHSGLLMQATHDYDFIDARSFLSSNIQQDDDTAISL